MYQGSHLSKNRCVLKHLLPSKHRSLVITSFLACKVVRSYAILDTPPTHLQSSALKPDFLKVEKSLTILCFSVFRWIKQIRQPSRFWQLLKKKFWGTCVCRKYIRSLWSFWSLTKLPTLNRLNSRNWANNLKMVVRWYPLPLKGDSRKRTKNTI